MADVDGQEKSEQPTSKKLDDTRKKGSVAKSMEINSFSIFMSGMFLLLIFQGYMSENISKMGIKIFSSLDVLEINQNIMQQYAVDSFIYLAILLGPILLGLMVVGVVTSVAQFGFQFSMKALAPKFSKFNLLSGIKNILFSPRAIIETLKSIIKLTLVALFAYNLVSALINTSIDMLNFSVNDIVQFMVSSAFSLIWKIGMVYAFIAAADFVYQKYKYKRDLMMTKNEVKEEIKQSEGDPHVKGQIRKTMMKLARKRMMQAVPTADVVITNPTHYAIAIKYEMAVDSAPRVVAKGVDEVAQKIKDIAKQNQIPIWEDVELARALYKVCEVGQLIPQNLFTSVAKILAFVFNLKNSQKKRSIV